MYTVITQFFRKKRTESSKFRILVLHLEKSACIIAASFIENSKVTRAELVITNKAVTCLHNSTRAVRTNLKDLNPENVFFEIEDILFVKNF